jgi:hypothetical protein
MSFLDIVKGRIGEGTYSRLESATEQEVALALKMPLVDGGDGNGAFYAQRFLLGELL